MVLRILVPAFLVLPCPLRVGASGDGTFQVPVEIPLSARGAVWLAAGDFDGNGALGLAAVSGGNRVTILEADPDDRERWAEQIIEPVGLGCVFVISADYDSDGDDDLFVADPSSVAYILRSRGDGAFDDPMALSDARGARAVATGDWNGDGYLDLATVNHPSPTVSIYLGSKTGAFFHPPNMNVGSQHHNHDLDVFEYDGDGNPDLLLAVDFTGIVPLRSQGDGTFIAQPPVPLLPDVIYAVSSDFNNDGLGDVIARSHGDMTTGVNGGDGSFRETQRLSHYFCVPARADLDGDGSLDLAGPAVGQGTLAIQLGKGDGFFSDPMRFTANFRSPVHMLAADVDGDGNPDLVSADQGALGVHVFWGAAGDALLEAGRAHTGFRGGAALAVADLDGDGKQDVFVSSTNEGVHGFLQPSEVSSNAPSFTLQPPQPLSSLDARDLDGDGTPDLAGTSPTGAGGSGSFVVAFLEPSGQIRTQNTIPAGDLPKAVRTGFIDEDVTVDLATACLGSNHVAVVLNEGGGAFSPPLNVRTVVQPTDVALGDVDADGHTDLVVVAKTEVAVHFGNGTGQFTDAVVVVLDDEGRFSEVAVADADQDGAADVFACEGSSSSIRLYHGRRNRVLEAGTVFELGAAPILSIAIADLDGNGFPDVTGCAARSLVVALHQGAMGFASPVVYPIALAAGHRLADLDADGAFDLVYFGDDTVSFLRGNSRRAVERDFTRGDADGSGERDLTDAVAVLARLFQGAEPLACDNAADVDDSGAVNLTDAVYLLLHLFRGGPAPGGPFPGCGADPTPDPLGCEAFPPCP